MPQFANALSLPAHLCLVIEEAIQKVQQQWKTIGQNDEMCISIFERPSNYLIIVIASRDQHVLCSLRGGRGMQKRVGFVCLSNKCQQLWMTP